MAAEVTPGETQYVKQRVLLTSYRQGYYAGLQGAVRNSNYENRKADTAWCVGYDRAVAEKQSAVIPDPWDATWGIIELLNEPNTGHLWRWFFDWLRDSPHEVLQMVAIWRYASHDALRRIRICDKCAKAYLPADAAPANRCLSCVEKK